MKKIILSALMSAVSVLTVAQDLTDAQKAALEAAQAINEAKQATPEVPKPQYWKTSLGFDIGLNQTGLVSWAAGGYNTVSLAAGIDARADYARKLMSWNNHMQLDYGFLWSADKKNLLQKSKDRIYLESVWGYKTAEKSKWNYSASFDFRSQFSNTFDNYKADNPEDPRSKWHGDLKSGLLSPAYTNLSLGMQWVPTKWFDINISPITGGFTIVTDPMLRKAYGMKARTVDPSSGEILDYKSSLFQLGAQMKANFKFNVNDKFKFESQFVYFTDYLDGPFHKSYRINWDNGISWAPAKFFKIAFNTWLIYDTNVLIKDNKDITEYPDGRKRVQFKEFLSISFTYSIANNK